MMPFTTELTNFSPLSGLFAKVRKSTIGFVMFFFLSLCLSAYVSVRPYLRPHRTTQLPLDGIFIKFYFRVFFENL